MNKFIMSIAIAVIAVAVGFVIASLTKNVNWGMLTTAFVFVGYIMFAIIHGRRTKRLKVK
ncbi:hypothetical protein pEaSNUABM5_00054 [Erwinia phage pEa_SNUABM_5]|uniref:Uncharacterized protein n=1 Tax=Erwinia phage pEa_SNUABM_5 TaxID=2797313 RepID=A0A7T8IVL9_9CAUD|nr:hypothetical protein MPK73_gp054 [Erwinia phage pEa_SNUABM_5]QQO90196.1 hypothetical protein pEaSNUABM5_00054 [Erwinia phage pEa_SNUABM_5]